MMWFTEFVCNPTHETQFNRAGTIELKQGYVAKRKPFWLVLLKLSIINVAIVSIAVAIVYTLELPVLPVLASTAAFFAIYCLAAFFLRPKPNTDNLGWAGGLIDDPFQYNDDINRCLIQLNVFLAPGRFITGAWVDAAVYCGLVKPRSVRQNEMVLAEQEQARYEKDYAERVADVEQRLAVRREGKPSGVIELDSAKYMMAAAEDSEQ